MTLATQLTDVIELITTKRMNETRSPGLPKNQRWQLLEYAVRDAFIDLVYRANWEPSDATDMILNIAGGVRGNTDVSHFSYALSLILQVGWTPVEQSKRAGTGLLIGFGTAAGTLIVTALNPLVGCAVGATALVSKGVFDIQTKAKSPKEAVRGMASSAAFGVPWSVQCRPTLQPQ